MPEYVDVIIPRGGKGLIQRITNEATILLKTSSELICLHVLITIGLIHARQRIIQNILHQSLRVIDARTSAVIGVFIYAANVDIVDNHCEIPP